MLGVRVSGPRYASASSVGTEVTSMQLSESGVRRSSRSEGSAKATLIVPHCSPGESARKIAHPPPINRTITAMTTAHAAGVSDQFCLPSECRATKQSIVPTRIGPRLRQAGFGYSHREPKAHVGGVHTQLCLPLLQSRRTRTRSRCSRMVRLPYRGLEHL